MPIVRRGALKLSVGIAAGADQDAFAALLELADQKDADESCASQNGTDQRPPSAGTQVKVASQGSEGLGGTYSQRPSNEPKASSRYRDRPDGTPQRSQKKRRSFFDGQENDSNATNTEPQAARPVHAEKRKVAAFTSALARDQDGPVNSHTADQGLFKKATMAPTREKYSGLRVGLRCPQRSCGFPPEAVMLGSLIAVCSFADQMNQYHLVRRILSLQHCWVHTYDDFAALLSSDSMLADEEPGVPKRRVAGVHVHAAVPATLPGRVSFLQCNTSSHLCSGTH